MCDPLSVTASALAVLTFAAQSCECVCKLLGSFSSAPKDLQHHIASLRALQSTFAGIAELEQSLPDGALITPEFKSRLQHCILDLQAMERLATPLCAQLEEGKARRAWARIRWSSADQRQKMKRHLSRIESYHRTFSLDLLLLSV